MLKNLGKTDIKVSSVIMGCWQIGGAPYWQGINDEESKRTVMCSFDNGINTFDTAPGYGNGHSERILGAVVKPIRNKVNLATKVFADKLAYKQVIESCEQSLKNLQTDYIDLLQIHFPSGSFGSKEISIEETLNAFITLKKDGKIRAIGVSNFSRKQLDEACRYAEIASIQPPYSLFWQKSAREIIPFCLENNISILSYSPLAQGLLTGKFGRTDKFSEDEVRSKQVLCEPDHYARVQNALDRLRPIADKYKTSLTNLAIAWLITQPQTFAVVGIRNEKQTTIYENVFGIKIQNDDLKEINAIGESVVEHLKDKNLMWNFE